MKRLGYLFVLILIISLETAGCSLIMVQKTTPASLPSFQVTFLDVGQAESTVVQCNDSVMLIDAGTNSTANSLVATLKNMGIRKLDVVVGTHPHEDHIGGMDAVINQFDIGTVYMAQVTATTKTFKDVVQSITNKGLKITKPVAGTSFSLGTATASILAPNSASYEEINDYSVVIRLLFGNTSFLFTGDAHVASEKEMLAKGYTLKSNVLKVGHHGSYSSTSQVFLNAVSAQYAVIMVGKDNDYGHPHQETLDKLNTDGAKIFRTDLNGNISFTSNGSSLTVKTAR